jgi:hypothetical protein
MDGRAWTAVSPLGLSVTAFVPLKAINLEKDE